MQLWSNWSTYYPRRLDEAILSTGPGQITTLQPLLEAPKDTCHPCGRARLRLVAVTLVAGTPVAGTFVG